MEWWSTKMASEIAMLITLEDAKCQFSSVLLCFGLFKKSMLTVVLDGVVVDEDGV